MLAIPAGPVRVDREAGLFPQAFPSDNLTAVIVRENQRREAVELIGRTEPTASPGNSLGQGLFKAKSARAFRLVIGAASQFAGTSGPLIMKSLQTRPQRDQVPPLAFDPCSAPAQHRGLGHCVQQGCKRPMPRPQWHLQSRPVSHRLVRALPPIGRRSTLPSDFLPRSERVALHLAADSES